MAASLDAVALATPEVVATPVEAVVEVVRARPLQLMLPATLTATPAATTTVMMVVAVPATTILVAMVVCPLAAAGPMDLVVAAVEDDGVMSVVVSSTVGALGAVDLLVMDMDGVVAMVATQAAIAVL